MTGPTDLSALAAAAARCADGREDLERRGHAPDGARRLRRFTEAETLARLPGWDAPRLRAAQAADPALPRARAAPDDPSRRFSFEEAQALRAALAPGSGLAALRPAGASARILAVSNFKGGVGKTSIAAHLAMAAAFDGARVLAVDLDSQGSLTSMLGGRPRDVADTAYPLLARDHALARQAAGLEADAEALALDPAAAIRPTHWPGLDLIGAQLELYWAEFQIPVWRMACPAWALWDALAAGLEAAGALDRYDLIVLDTPPALGYLTVNALAAADLVLIPLGATFLDFDSTGRFLDMLHATFASIEEGEAEAARALGRPAPRFEWDAVRAVLTRYDAAQQAEMAAHAEAWLGELMLPCRLEATALVGQAGEQARGLLEADPRDFNRETWRRGRETFDRLYDEVRILLGEAWARDAEEMPDAAGPGSAAGQGADVSHAKHPASPAPGRKHGQEAAG